MAIKRIPYEPTKNEFGALFTPPIPKTVPPKPPKPKKKD